jgi:hypothetical protein
LATSGTAIGVLILLTTLMVGALIFYSLGSQTLEQALDEVVGEVVGTANGTGYLSASLAHGSIDPGSETIYCNDTPTSSYTLTYSTGAIVVDGSDCANDVVEADYSYQGTAYSNMEQIEDTGWNSLQMLAISAFVAAAVTILAILMVLGRGGRSGGL